MNYDGINLVFLTHLSRSGSTLLARMLDDYDDVCVTTEAELPLELFGVKNYTPISFYSESELRSYLKRVLLKTRFSTWNINYEEVIILFQKAHSFPIMGPDLIRILLFLYREKHSPGAKVVIYKSCPLMPWHIRESSTHFPKAKYLHLIRDPRAVYFSQLKNMDPHRGVYYSKSALETAMYWENAVTTTKDLSEQMIMNINYEKIILNPVQSMNQLAIFLNISQKKTPRDRKKFAERMDLNDKILHKDIQSKPDLSKINYWEKRIKNKDRNLIELYLYKHMKTNGYLSENIIIEENLSQKIMILLKKLIVNLRITKNRFLRISIKIVDNPVYFFKQLRLKIFNG